MEKFEKEWRERFKRFAESYKDDHLVSGWSDNGLRCRLVLFEKLLGERGISAPAKILDLGCGAGTYVRFLTSLGHRVVGLDYSLPSLNRAQAADPKQAGHYAVGDAYNLPFCKESYDLVVSVGVFQTLECPGRALDEMVRVLRPKGLIVVDFLNAFELVAMVKAASERLSGRLPRVRTNSPFQVRRWLTQRNIRHILRAGVYLPPRNFPQLQWILDRKWFISLMEGFPGLSLAGAHAFMLIGEKETVYYQEGRPEH